MLAASRVVPMRFPRMHEQGLLMPGSPSDPGGAVGVRVKLPSPASSLESHVLEVIHRPASSWGWEFSCGTARSVEGGARTYRASVAAAEHSARLYLSHGADHPVELQEARRELSHVRAEARSL